MINVVTFDPQAHAVQQVVEITDFLHKQAQEGAVVDIVGVAIMRDGNIVTFVSDSEDHIKRLGAVTQLQVQLAFMSEFSDD